MSAGHGDLLLPNRIVVMRNGEGTGLYGSFQQHEGQQIMAGVRQATLSGFPDQNDEQCQAALRAAEAVPLTYAVCEKRVDQTMVQISDHIKRDIFEEGTALDQLITEENVFNAPYGALVRDPNVVSDPESEFFLFALNSSPSTVRSVKYKIVHDSPDDASGRPLGWDMVAELGFRLSHLFYNWPGPVLIPAPLQYAIKAAFQGTTVFKQELFEKVYQFWFHEGLASL